MTPNFSVLWTPEETANWLKISLSQLKKLRHASEGPAYITLGVNTVRYNPRRVIEWADSLTVETDDSTRIRQTKTTAAPTGN